MARVGVYGGSFNPPHIGHIQAAREAVAALKLDRMILIPAGVAPHKSLPEVSATPRQRLEMLSIAAEGEPKLELSAMELEREGPSYTWQTLKELKKRFPEDELFFLMGTDMFLTFQQWKEPERILADATLAVVCRGIKKEKEAIAAQKALLEQQGDRICLVENTINPISSTQLRRLLAFRCADRYLPCGVAAYIQENGLYDSGANWENLSMEALEPIVLRLLNPNRVAHVLGCRDTAVELARHWGADERDAARAGLLHDITKALDGPLQFDVCGAYGEQLSAFSRKYPRTLHAVTGALVAKYVFGENEAVVSAIRHHTTGKAGMNLLETILYVADYMEPNRDFPGVEELRRLAFSDIQGALRLGLEMTLEHLNNQGSEVSPESQEALAFLRNRK